MIKMNHVQKSYGTQKVLHSISFEAKQKQIFGLLGPSGAGKTTIINILANQITADSGEHIVDAQPLEIGLMLDEDGLYPRLSCLDNLNVFAKIYNMPKSKSEEALRNVGLIGDKDKAVNTLSKGMRQRLALARAILHEPKVLFLDEPTSGLDPGTAKEIHTLIKSIRDRGTTIFMTTHNMEEATELCDEIVLLSKGSIVEHGTPKDICTRHNAFKTVPDLGAVFIKMTNTQKEVA